MKGLQGPWVGDLFIEHAKYGNPIRALICPISPLLINGWRILTLKYWAWYDSYILLILYQETPFHFPLYILIVTKIRTDPISMILFPQQQISITALVPLSTPFLSTTSPQLLKTHNLLSSKWKWGNICSKNAEMHIMTMTSWILWLFYFLKPFIIGLFFHSKALGGTQRLSARTDGKVHAGRVQTCRLGCNGCCRRFWVGGGGKS